MKRLKNILIYLVTCTCIIAMLPLMITHAEDKGDQYFNSNYFYAWSENGKGNFGNDDTHRPYYVLEKLKINGKNFYKQSIAYCLDSSLSAPSHVESPFNDDEGKTYKNNFDLFLRNPSRNLWIVRGTAENATDEQISGVIKGNPKINNAKRARKILYNGFTIDKSNLQEIYHLSNMQFQMVTQAAIWEYVDNHDLDQSKPGHMEKYIRTIANSYSPWDKNVALVYMILTEQYDDLKDYLKTNFNVSNQELEQAIALINGLKQPGDNSSNDPTFKLTLYEKAGGVASAYQRLLTANNLSELQVKVKKQWLSNPKNVTLKAINKATNEVIDSHTIQATEFNNNEKSVNYTFKNLPTHDANMNKIEYEIREDSIEGVNATISGNMNDGFTIINKEESPELNTTVQVDEKSASDSRELVITALKDHQVYEPEINVSDVVSYKNLKPNTNYYLEGKLIDVTDQNKVITSKKITFATTDKNGNVILHFDKAKLKVNHKYVVFENAWEARLGENKPSNNVISHESINDKAQTILVKPGVEIQKIASDTNQLLSGAKLALYKGTQSIETWFSDNNPKLFTLDSGEYTLKELSAPENYAKADDITFTILNDGTIAHLSNNTISMKDMRKKVVKFSKKILNGTNELSGATLNLYEIKDNQATQIQTWISSHEDKELSLAPGNYRLEEVTAPLGYSIAESIDFTINSNGQVIRDGKVLNEAKVVMYDKKNVSFSKRTLNGTSELLGARIKVIKDTGDLVEEWVSGNSEKMLSLGVGSYKFIEVAAPEHYDKAEAILFRITDEGKVQVFDQNEYKNVTDSRIIMRDARKEKVKISKISLTNGQELPGASLTLTDLSTQKTLYSWTSTNTPFEFELVQGHYRLTESIAPRHYEKAESIDFELKEDGKVYIKDKVLNENTIVMKDAEAFDIIFSKTIVNGTKELPGATLRLFKGENVSDEPYLEWISTHEARTFSLTEGLYTLQEIQSPNGYEVAENITFKVNSQGKISIKQNDGRYLLLQDNKVRMQDAKKVLFSKTDLNGTKELDGAHLSLKDKNNQEIDSWISKAGEKHLISLGVGEYTLTETIAPNDYVISEDIKFKVDEQGKLYVYHNNAYVLKDDDLILIKNARSQDVTFSKTRINGTSELPGATLEIYKDGQLIKSFISTNVPHTFKLVEGNYTLVEKRAPKGYSVAESIDFKITSNGDVLIKENNEYILNPSHKVRMQDKQATKVTLSKTIVNGTKELPGAKLELYRHMNNNVSLIDSWISTEKQKDVLLEEGIYTFKEIQAPNGYEVAEKITFKVDENGLVFIKQKDDSYIQANENKVKMEDAKKVTFSKMNLNHTREISGAKVTVYSKTGKTRKIIDSWISTNVPHTLNLGVGEYEFEENIAPKDYALSEDILFKIDNAGKVYVKENERYELNTNSHVIMKDARLGRVSISKVDINSSEELPGATLKIYDDNNQEIASWVSTKQKHHVILKEGSYKLVEITAPHGYTIAKDIHFRVNDLGQVEVLENGRYILRKDSYIQMKDAPIQQPQNKKSHKKVNKKVKTYDSMHFISYILSGFISLILLMLIYKRIKM